MNLKFLLFLPITFLTSAIHLAAQDTAQSSVLNTFPDGSVISPWFLNSAKIKLKGIGKKFVLTKFGVKKDSTICPSLRNDRLLRFIPLLKCLNISAV